MKAIKTLIAILGAMYSGRGVILSSSLFDKAGCAVLFVFFIRHIVKALSE